MNTRNQPSHSQQRSELGDVLERNIQTLIAHHHAQEQRRRFQDYIADAITNFTGSMLFVYLHIAIFGLWIIINLGWTPLPKFDPSFVVLAMVASVEAIFLSTFVLISQNRLAALNEKRADLNLQISLLAEHEVTQLIKLVTEMAKRMGIEEAGDPKLAELAQNVAPEKVLDKLEEYEQNFSGKRQG